MTRTVARGRKKLFTKQRTWRTLHYFVFFLLASLYRTNEMNKLTTNMANTSSKAGMRIAYSCGRNRRNMTLSLSANGYTTTISLRCDDMSVSLNDSEVGTYQQEDPCRIVRENDGGCRNQNGSESLICNPHVTDVFTLISLSQMNLLKIDDLTSHVLLTALGAGHQFTTFNHIIN